MANPVSSRMRGRWRLALFATGMLSLATALAGGHKTIGPRVEREVPDEVRTGVTAIVEETANRWNSQDYATLLGLWDTAEAYPTYLAEEQAEWFVGWDRLRRYLDPPRPIPVIEAIRMFAEDVRVKQIAPGLAVEPPAVDPIASSTALAQYVAALAPWLSDALCVLATGGGYATRKLYADYQEMLFDAGQHGGVGIALDDDGASKPCEQLSKRDL